MTFSILMSAAVVAFLVLMVEPMPSLVRRWPRGITAVFLLAAVTVAALASSTGAYALSVSVVVGGFLGTGMAGLYQVAELKRTQLH